MKTKTILIFVFVFLLALPLIAIISKGEEVLTSDEAEAIALNYVSKINNGKFTDCEIIGTEYENGIWLVGFGSTKEEYKYMAGGGFPVVFIDETNSRNITHLYQK